MSKKMLKEYIILLFIPTTRKTLSIKVITFLFQAWSIAKYENVLQTFKSNTVKLHISIIYSQ